VARHDYLPYGEEIPNGTASSTGSQFGVSANVNQKFTGQERDPEMTPNSDFFNARYFSAAAGSFLRPDPANAGADLGNPQTWNGYGYVSGNPLNSTDPTGMSNPCENNTSCMAQIPGCLSNPTLCAQAYFYPDAIVGGIDAFNLQGLPSYQPPFWQPNGTYNTTTTQIESGLVGDTAGGSFVMTISFTPGANSSFFSAASVSGGTLTLPQLISIAVQHNLSHLDNKVVACLAMTESGGNPQARAKKPNTATGLMQVNKATAQAVATQNAGPPNFMGYRGDGQLLLSQQGNPDVSIITGTCIPGYARPR